MSTFDKVMDDGFRIPIGIKESIDLYVKVGIEPGGFTRAVLENNLTEAIGRADNWSLLCLKAIVVYCYNEIPSKCWGSREKVAAWLLYHQKQKNEQAGVNAEDSSVDPLSGPSI